MGHVPRLDVGSEEPKILRGGDFGVSGVRREADPRTVRRSPSVRPCSPPGGAEVAPAAGVGSLRSRGVLRYRCGALIALTRPTSVVSLYRAIPVHRRLEVTVLARRRTRSP